jgi:hypothetical protein
MPTENSAGGAENDLSQLIQVAIRDAIYPLNQEINQLKSQQEWQKEGQAQEIDINNL